jgi:hypothetical protein
MKRVTASGVFYKNNETRHWQWRAAIRIFEILQFLLLFLININLIIIIITKNCPTGDVVDKPLKEEQSRDIKGNTNVRGSYIFSTFLGKDEFYWLVVLSEKGYCEY